MGLTPELNIVASESPTPHVPGSDGSTRSCDLSAVTSPSGHVTVARYRHDMGRCGTELFHAPGGERDWRGRAGPR